MENVSKAQPTTSLNHLASYGLRSPCYILNPAQNKANITHENKDGYYVVRLTLLGCMDQ